MGSMTKETKQWNYAFRIKKNTNKEILTEINEWIVNGMKGDYCRNKNTIFIDSLDDSYRFKMYFFCIFSYKFYKPSWLT